LKRPTFRFKAAPKAVDARAAQPGAKAAGKPAAKPTGRPWAKPSGQAAAGPAAAAKPAPKPASPRPSAPQGKPKPVFRRDRKPQLRRFPKLALHKHPTTVAYGPDEWRMVLDALPLVQQWLREQAPGAPPQAGPMDLQIASVRVWESEELDYLVLNLKREPVQVAFGPAKAALIAERAAEVQVWLEKLPKA